jgi:hypothetical protein
MMAKGFHNIGKERPADRKFSRNFSCGRAVGITVQVRKHQQSVIHFSAKERHKNLEDKTQKMPTH